MVKKGILVADYSFSRASTVMRPAPKDIGGGVLDGSRAG
jgi:hypothetical protein